MTFNIKQHKDELLFLPLGGAGEIGMNVNLYHYKGKWIMIDLGAGFADEYLPGCDMILPDISFIREHRKDLLGIILTHAHEDHLGAVQYLWEELRCPIFTTKFTANVLQVKLDEMKLTREVPITEIEEGSKFNLGPFNIELMPLNHTTPEMQAIIVKTAEGNIFHTGDWKFDHDPLIGFPNDQATLKSYGDEGILALVGDSTNVFNPGKSGSEGDLRKSLEELISGCKQLVVVTTFASNVARIESIIKAAESCGRRVLLAGRSLHRITRAAKEAGYLHDVNPFLEDTQLARTPRHKILVISTGCQGEPLAATTKIASGNHPFLKLNPDDTVIFSSKIIPGNEKRIFRLFNQFVKMRVEVFTEKDHFVHVSGHPAKEELELMYKLIRPKIAIPVHGELVHMHEHARLAKEWGVKKTIQVENGIVVRLAPGEAKKIAEVKAGFFALDGNYLVSPNSSVMKMRRRLKNEGIIFITLLLNAHGVITHKPLISAPGVLDIEQDKELMDDIVKEIYKVLPDSIQTKAKSFNKKKKTVNATTSDNIINLTRAAIRRIIRPELGKDPVIEIHIEHIPKS